MSKNLVDVYAFHLETIDLHCLKNLTEENYFRFKALYGVLKDNPNSPDSFKEELKRLGKELYQDKEFMNNLNLLERNEAKNIERINQEKLLEKQLSLELDKGGLPM